MINAAADRPERLTSRSGLYAVLDFPGILVAI